MGNKNNFSRRIILQSSVFGLIAVSIPNIGSAKYIKEFSDRVGPSDKVFHRYPSIDDSIVNEMVSVSHFNFDRVKELVNKRPVLALANWDWAFGDWESALGAASHVGRRDIAEFLISKGARPNIFTFAMLGNYQVVKSLVETMPGIQKVLGPHGINLMRHAKAGLRSKELSKDQIANSEKIIALLEEIGGSNASDLDIEMSMVVKETYLGDYMYGDGEKDGFSVQLNMRDNLSLGKLGKFGGALYQKSKNVFSYNGISSVEISFEVIKEKVISLTVHEPDLELKAIKV